MFARMSRYGPVAAGTRRDRILRGTAYSGTSRHVLALVGTGKLVEQQTLNLRVRGSSPWRRTHSDLGFYRSRLFFMCPVCPHVGSVLARVSGPGRGKLVQSGRIGALRRPSWLDNFLDQWSRPSVFPGADPGRLPSDAVTQRETCW